MKKSRKFRKKLTVGLVSLLTISSMPFGKGPVRAGTLPTDKLVQLSETDQLHIQPSDYYGPHDKVRVVVELDKAPAISYSTNLGIRYKDLPESKKLELQSDIKEDQGQFLSEIKEEKMDFKVQNTFTTVVNGVSGDVEYGDIATLEKLPDVEKVSIVNEYERPVEKPDMLSSKDMIGAIQTWNTGFTGKGMVIGIIDTGIDYSHNDMVLAPDPAQKLNQTKITDFKNTLSLPGKYYTVKVPYGYNYFDKNDTILDLGPAATMHGMHVAGTAGANGNEKNNGIKGVAPDAQLLALKVFSNDPAYPSTFGDIYVKAIDDGIKLGADVLNMSLGSTAGFVSPDSFEQSAIERATQNGVVMSVSAGNSAQISSPGTWGNPLASNPDIGLVGAPGTSPGSISVASISNDKITLDKMNVTIGGQSYPIAFKRQSSPNPNEVLPLNTDLDVVYVGDGSTAAYTGKDVKGKIVYAVRDNDTNNYAAIQKNAEKAGAAGVIVRGMVSHGDYVSMSLSSPVIPVASIGISDGNMLVDKFNANGGTGKVKFTGTIIQVVNSNAGKMASSTSWGVTPNLDLKPEITAPGDQIYSTFNDNKYGVMSGTSMAAPHVSGGSALVMQRVQQLFPNLQGADKVKRVKTLLMNTAKPIVDPDDNNILYSPRRQGAGLMQLFKAVTTPVYIVNKGTNDGKIELKEINSDKFTMTVTATNFSDQDITYDVNASVLTDGVANGRNTLHEQVISKASVVTDSPRVTLLAGQTKDITVRVDLTNAKADLEAQMKNGYFVEGFITLTNVNNDTTQAVSPDLSIPYVGFKGDWNAPPILDTFDYDGAYTFEGSSGMVDQGAYMGYNPWTQKYSNDLFAISPNGDGQGDAITPFLIFLRNSKTVEYSITDANGNMIRKLYTDYNVRKNYAAQRPMPASYIPTYTKWDGYADNTVVADGLYYYQIKTQVDLAGKPQQVTKIPVIVDNTRPVVTNASYSKKNGLLYFDATDAGIGLKQIDIKVDGKAIGTLNPTGKSSFVVDLSKTPVNKSIDIIALDYAKNSVSVSVSPPGDNTIPYITSLSPQPMGRYDTKEIPLNGSIEDASKIANLQIKGEGVVGSPVNVNLTYIESAKVYIFNQPISFKSDGVQEVYLEGEDTVGNKIGFRRILFIDTEAPTLNISGLPANNWVPSDGKNPQVTVNIADNFDELRLVVNGSEQYRHIFDQPYERRPLSYDHNMTLNLKDGRNDFVFEVTDLTGHKVKKSVTLYKGGTMPNAFVSELSVTPDKMGAGTSATIKAEASKSITWDVKVIDPDGNTIAMPSSKGKTYEGVFTPGPLAASGHYTVVVGPAGGSSASVQKTVINVENHVVSTPTNPSVPVVKSVTSKSTVITGKAESGVKVIATDRKKLKITTVAKAGGSFSIKLPSKQLPNTKLYITAVNAKGLSSKELVIVVSDKTAPSAPQVKALFDKDKAVTGKAETHSTITVKVGSKIIAKGKANSKGEYSITIKPQKAATGVFVTATDAAGNVSPVTKVVVKVTVPPVPKVSTVTTTKVSGKAEAGTKVYIKNGKNVIGTATVKSNGKFTLSIKKQKVGKVLSVYAKNKAGNTSKVKRVVVKK